MKIKRMIALLVCCVAFGLCSITVSADMGPKPQLDILVEHPPQERYYLDLLVEMDAPYDNLRERRETCDAAMLTALCGESAAGWYPALSYGDGVPLFGTLEGEAQPNGSILHHFSYFGVPDDYRIIIVTESGGVKVSPPQHKITYAETVRYDYQANTVQRPSRVKAYLTQFATTFVPTLLLETLLLLPFGYKIRKNFATVTLANLVTQLALTLMLGYYLNTQGLLAGYFYLPGLELVVLLAEALWYRKRLRHPAAKNDGFGTHWRQMAQALCWGSR